MRKIVVFLLIWLLSNPVLALEVSTHRAINEAVATISLPSGFNLGSYLQANLGFSQGTGEMLSNNRTVQRWLALGGEYEDIPALYLPYIRSLNHFHNPLTEEGFKGDCLQSSLCVSSTVWALMPLGTQSSLTGNYSWYDVRAYYYTALTGRDYSGNIIAADKTQRDSYFAETFRGFGQLMHLIEDLSVPEHTRNDFHLLYNYEKFAESYVEEHGVPSPGSSDYFSGTINSISSFMDTDQYDGTNPNVTLQSNIGLSEYTNANFMSPGSYFTFPYPNWESVVEFEEQVSGKKRTYLRKLGQGETEGIAVGNGAHIEHLALTGRMYKLLPAALKKKALRPVYTDYAQKLIPRAVGYSAGQRLLRIYPPEPEIYISRCILP